MPLDFDASFLGLTGHPPFPWQRSLYATRFVRGDFPAACAIPHALGKTAVAAVWLLALAESPSVVPRRLVYAVSRRTAIDQASTELESFRERLITCPALAAVAARLRALCPATSDTLLNLNTPRGPSANDRAWLSDPTTPAVVVGSVDTVGRGLLFSGFGCGAARRATLAGLLGQDALLVIDDAHHEPAFQRLCQAVADEQRREGGLRRLHSLSLLPSWQGPGDIHRLDDTDLADPAVRRRLEAVKKLRLHPLEDARREAEGLTTLALALKDCGRAVAVFARDADSAEAVTKALRRHAPAELLTERLRGYELDSLVATSGVFARFLPTAERRSEPTARTVYLVCTEGGEVGVNTSADHVVADLVPFERMAQRFARLNRFGDRTDAEAHVLYPAHFAYSAPCPATRTRLASPGSTKPKCSWPRRPSRRSSRPRR